MLNTLILQPNTAGTLHPTIQRYRPYIEGGEFQEHFPAYGDLMGIISKVLPFYLREMSTLYQPGIQMLESLGHYDPHQTDSVLQRIAIGSRNNGGGNLPGGILPLDYIGEGNGILRPVHPQKRETGIWELFIHEQYLALQQYSPLNVREV
jgi:hypothetical protein